MKKKTNKDKNKDNWKYIYATCNHNKYSQLTNIMGKSEVKSNIKNFLANYKAIVITVSLIFLALFIYAFRNNPKIILCCVGFMFLLFILIMYSSTYKLTLDESKLTIHMRFQNTIINTNDLANIYISRDKVHFMGIPIYTYLLNIIYIVNEKPVLISLPVVMTNGKSIKKLFSNIETEKIKDDEEEMEDKNKTKNNKIVILIIVIAIVLFFTASVITAIIYNKNRNAVDLANLYYIILYYDKKMCEIDFYYKTIKK